MKSKTHIELFTLVDKSYLKAIKEVSEERLNTIDEAAMVFTNAIKIADKVYNKKLLVVYRKSKKGIKEVQIWE